MIQDKAYLVYHNQNLEIGINQSTWKCNNRCSISPHTRSSNDRNRCQSNKYIYIKALTERRFCAVCCICVHKFPSFFFFFLCLFVCLFVRGCLFFFTVLECIGIYNLLSNNSIFVSIRSGVQRNGAGTASHCTVKATRQTIVTRTRTTRAPR